MRLEPSDVEKVHEELEVGSYSPACFWKSRQTVSYPLAFSRVQVLVRKGRLRPY